MARRRFAVLASLAVVIAVLSSLFVSLAVNAVPKSWGWAHDWWLLLGIGTALLVAGVLVAVVQARSPGEAGTPDAGKQLRAGDTLPWRNPVFTGRDEMLAEVWRRLTDGPVAVIAVRGLGGIGKSQVALEYAHRMRRSGRYRVAGWVRADSAVTMAADLAAMAPVLGLPADGPAGEVAASVVAALRLRRDWLMVFDNAQAPGDLTGMLPGGGGHVLITSRNRVWSGVASQLDVEVFSRPESVTFLCKRSGCAEPEAAAELAAELGDLPLALAQAAAYVDTQAVVTISGYLARYRDPALARRLRDAGLDLNEYPASVARTWLLTFEQLSVERPAAIALLRLCAFLDPDDIDLEVLAGGAQGRLEREEAAGALARVSLVSATAENRLRVHRLVQAVTRDQLDDDQTDAWSRRALSLVSAAFPEEPEDHRCWPVCASVAPHVEAVTAHAERHPDLTAERGILLSRLGTYLMASGQFRAALNVMERALAVNEVAYGPNHTDVAASLNNLGLAQARLGELSAARITLERALAIKEATCGPDHPDVAFALNSLSTVQLRLGDLPTASANLERALAIYKAACGPDHPEVARALRSLSIVQMRLGELPAARASLERALAIYEGAYEADHPNVVSILTALAPLQAAEGELPAARAAIERALATNEAMYRPDHPLLSPVLVSLGVIQGEQGELPAARATLERALAINEATYEPDHPDIAVVLSSLGYIQMQLGELPAARASLERALAIEEAAYGPDHPESVDTLNKLGLTQARLGELPAARTTLERALAIGEAAYGPDHPILDTTRADLRLVQQELDDQ